MSGKCGFVRRYGIDVWKDILDDPAVSDEDLYDRLKDFWSLVASLCALMAGFSFVVVVAEGAQASFTDIRIRGYGYTALTTFTCSLGGTLMGSMLYAYLVMAGKTNVGWFVREFSIFFMIPSLLLGVGVVAMLGATMVAIGHWMPDDVYWFTVILGAIIFLCILAVNMVILPKTTKFVAQQKNQHKQAGVTPKVTVQPPLKEPMSSRSATEDAPAADNDLQFHS